MQTITNITYSMFTLIAVACFAFAPQARATCQEACLTNSNTVLGDDALLNNTSGFSNTATGARALTSNTTGTSNSAIGSGALSSNIDGYQNVAVGAAALSTNSSGI